MDIAFGVILLVLSVALTVLVLFQSGKDKHLSGTIAGGAETFFGKSKAKDSSKALSIATAVISGVFAITVLVAFLMLG